MYGIKAKKQDYWASHKKKKLIYLLYLNFKQNNVGQGQQEVNILYQLRFTYLALILTLLSY